jgi:hypothetical protein
MLGANAAHLCVAVQRQFSAEGPWPPAWMDREVVSLAERAKSRTIFTRFIPPRSPQEMPGQRSAYYTKWSNVTRTRLDNRLLDLVPELESFPPAAPVRQDDLLGFRQRQLA